MKTIVTTLFAALLYCNCASAQQDFRLLSGNQEIIQNAVDSAIVIIRQDYILQSRNHPGLNFGRGENQYFGRKYALAVVAGQYLLFDHSLETPWMEDPNFSEYKNIDSLRPVLSETWVRRIQGSQYTKIIKDSLSGTLPFDSLYNISGIGICPSPFPAKGLQVKTQDTLREGWLVLGSSETDLLQNDTLPVKISIYREKPDYDPTEKAGKIKSPANPTRILGGFFVLPGYSTGKVQFFLNGIFMKKILHYYIASIPEVQIPATKTQSNLPLKPITN